MSENNVVNFPDSSAEKLEIMCVEADQQLCDWVTMKLEAGISAYSLLGIITINSSWLAQQVLAEQENYEPETD
jgi:hypothetical protein